MTDKIKNGKVKIRYYPTKDMLGDFFTKPLQGSAFIKMRTKILNLPSNVNDTVHRSVLRIDKFNENRKPKDKDVRGRNATRGSSADNAKDFKWAKGTKEGNMGSKVSK